MPPPITRQTLPISAAPSRAVPELGRRDTSPQQAQTRAFITSGALGPLLGLTATAPRHATGEVLEQLKQHLGCEQPSLAHLAQLSQQLAEAAVTTNGGQALAAPEQQRTLQSVLEQCKARLELTPTRDPAHERLLYAHDQLRQARFHQAIGHWMNEPNMPVSCLPDLFALARLDARELAKRPEGVAPYMLFGSFIRMAKHRSVELADALLRRPEQVEPLLRPHVDSLQRLSTLPEALEKLKLACPDSAIKQDLSDLLGVVDTLLQQLRTNHVLAAPDDSDHGSVQAAPEARRKAALVQALRNTGSNLMHKFDGYGAVAPMDDQALLALFRSPAPHLLPEQMHAFLNKHVIELSDEQLNVINNTQLPPAQGSDPEAGVISPFDEKMRIALASGTLVLSEEQLASLNEQPALDGANAPGLKPLMDTPTAELSETDRQMLDAVLQGNAAGKIGTWQQHNAQLPGLLSRSGLPAPVRKELLSINQAIDTELDTLKQGASLFGRLTASPAMLLALAPLPLAVAFVSGDKPYSSSLIAHFSKNAVFMAGLMMNELTNNRTNLDHLLNRYFVTVLANVLVAEPTFAHNEHLLEKIGFGMATAVVSGGVTLGVFNRDAIWAAVKSAKNKLIKADAGETAVSEADRDAVAKHFSQGEHIAQQMKVAADVFKKDRAVTDTFNSSLTFLGSKSSQIKALYETAEARRAGLELSSTPRKDDPDFYPKMGLVVLTAGISAALVVLMESLVGKADYAADGMWCTSEMLKLALNPDADMQKAVQTFKEIVGLNLVLTAFLGVNKVWDFLDKGAKGYIGGAAVLSAANLTLPGMVGEAAGSTAGKGLSYLADKGKVIHQASTSAIAQTRGYANARLGSVAQAARSLAPASGSRNAGALVPCLHQQFYELSRRAGPTRTGRPTGFGEADQSQGEPSA